MRDANRMKEKYELSLDNRQIISLTIGGAVMVGAVFVLGVVIGKKLAAEGSAAQPPDLLAALDLRAGIEPASAPDASLTFQDELTKKPTPIVDVKPPEPPKAEVAPVHLLSADLAKTEAVPTRISEDAGALREAIARIQKPAEVSADGAFTLQLSAYQERAEADRFAARLRDKGYAPFVAEVVLPGKGTWYRVRMGRFPTREAAGRYLSDFKRETSIDAIVTGAGASTTP